MRALTLLDLEFVLCAMIVGIIVLEGNQLIYASPLPANHTDKSKFHDPLKIDNV